MTFTVCMHVLTFACSADICGLWTKAAEERLREQAVGEVTSMLSSIVADNKKLVIDKVAGLTAFDSRHAAHITIDMVTGQAEGSTATLFMQVSALMACMRTHQKMYALQGIACLCKRTHTVACCE